MARVEMVRADVGVLVVTSDELDVIERALEARIAALHGYGPERQQAVDLVARIRLQRDHEPGEPGPAAPHRSGHVGPSSGSGS